MSNLNSEMIGVESDITNMPIKTVPQSSTKRESRRRRLMAKAFKPAIREGTVVLFDQGFCSIANFMTGILVARACSKDEYGVYVLGFTLLVTVELVQRCLISVPLTVLSPHLEGRDYTAYLGNTLIHHFVFSGIATVGFVLAASILFLTKQGHGMRAVLIVLSFASVPMLLRDFMRYVLLAQLRVWQSLLMGLAANVAIVGMLSWSYVGGWLTAPVAYLILGGCSGLPAIIMLLSIGRYLRPAKNRLLHDLRKDWRFGRWTLAATGASMIGERSVPWFVLFWCGSSSVAVFGVLMAMAGIIRPLIMGVSAYLTPKLAHHIKSRGSASAIKVCMKVIGAMGILGGVYVVFMWVLGEKMVGLLYTVRYQGYLMTLGIIAIGTSLGAICTILKALIRVIGNPEIEFWSSGCASVVCIIISISLIPRLGILGAAIAITGTNLTFAVVTGLRIAWIARSPVISYGIRIGV